MAKDNAYKDGYERGIEDGRNKRARKLKPSLVKSVLAPHYLRDYQSGYKDGHYAGLREARYNELGRRPSQSHRSSTGRDER